MMVTVIVACEFAFWILLGLGLLARYGLRRRSLGSLLLLMVPVVDVVLLAVTAVDLRGGGHAGIGHALAAVYLGVSVGFGHQIITRMDARAAHRWDGAPKPVGPPRSGRAHAVYNLRQLSRHYLAYAVGAGLLGLAVLYVGDTERAGAFVHMATLWTIVLVVDTIWSLSYFVWPRKPKAGSADGTIGKELVSR